MEVFNKYFSQVSSSVSQTVSQLSNVLPGNPVTREYESIVHIASAGPGLLWKIYKGIKRSTKEEASLFVFEKRQLDKWNKTDRDLILETLKRGVQQLTKIRHPQILIVQHPLEESRDSLAFASEPIFSSLANVLGETNNMPQPSINMADYKLYDIEIKYGLLQLSEGLAFLHNDMKLLHKNLTPENIIINSSGVWKIFGFDFSILQQQQQQSGNVQYQFHDYSPTLPLCCQPNLNYLAPECILLRSHSNASDLFSIGMIIYVLHSPVKQCYAPIKEYKDFKNTRVQQLQNLNMNKLQTVPVELKDATMKLLSINSETRLDVHQFIKLPYFNDIGIKTLTYLDSLLQWDNLQRSQFYKGLPETLVKLPHRVKLQRVLTCLLRDLGNPIMVPFILPSIFDIAKECTADEYKTCILPHLKPLMKLTEPVQIPLLMLQQMELLLKLTPSDDIQQHVLPMLYQELDSDSNIIHELCLSVLPNFAQLLDHGNVKNSLLPRIKKLCLNTSNLSIRVNCLLCIGKLLEHFDKWLVIDQVLPFLPQIPSREPAVLMGILGVYKIAMTHKKLGINKEILATRVLPFLIPLCIENGLSLAQFNAITTMIKDMFQLVENEHLIKLKQLNSVKDEQKSLNESMTSISCLEKSINSINPNQSKLLIDNDFIVSTQPLAPPPSAQPLSQYTNHSNNNSFDQIINSNLNQLSIAPSPKPTTNTSLYSQQINDNWMGNYNNNNNNQFNMNLLPLSSSSSSSQSSINNHVKLNKDDLIDFLN